MNAAPKQKWQRISLEEGVFSRVGWLEGEEFLDKQREGLHSMHYHRSAAAKSLQSCLTLWDPIDGSPPGSPVPGVLQARTLEWVAISFPNAWKWKVKGKSLSRARLLATPWIPAYQAPPSIGQEGLWVYALRYVWMSLAGREELGREAHLLSVITQWNVVLTC